MQSKDSKTIAIIDWFTTSFNPSTSSEWCTQLVYSIKEAPNCNSALNLPKPYISLKQNISGNYIEVDGNNEVNTTTFCLQAITKGG